MIIRITLLTLLLSLWPSAMAQWHSHSWDSMGTRATLEFWLQSDQGEVVIEAVQQEFQRIEQQLSPWIPESELASFNRLPANHHFAASNEFRFLLERSGYYSSLSNGAFDITFAGAGHLYDYRAARAPDDDTLQRAVIGMQHILLHEDG
ncbi:MAG: FAD:protein FMN transferase, partial [Alcanivoracaceae bacterium]|nr:FAD:protein FMN transferase [Alcanivoracaceae bacterium]